MRILKALTITIMALIFIEVNVKDSMAVPSFAKNTKMSCTVCHKGWPRLSKIGRAYKEDGFSPARSLLAARLNLRLADKRFSKAKNGELTGKDRQFKLRSLHEVEIFIAGEIAKNVAVFAEIEAEDEWPDPAGNAPGFQAQLAMGYARLTVSDSLVLYAGYGSPFTADGYNTVNSHKNTRHEWKAAKYLPGEGQFMSLSGRLASPVFYILAYGGDEGNLEGPDPKNISGRVMVDLTNAISMGGFYSGIRRYNGVKSSNEERKYGNDIVITLGDLSVDTIMVTRDNGKSIDRVFSSNIQWNKSGMIPQIIYSNYTKKEGRFQTVGTFLTKYLTPNVKFQVGWEGDITTPKDNGESRATFVVDLGI